MTCCEDCSRSTSAWILSKKKWPRLKRVRELKALFYVLSDRFEVCSFAGQPRVSALRCSTIVMNLLIVPFCFLSPVNSLTTLFSFLAIPWQVFRVPTRTLIYTARYLSNQITIAIAIFSTVTFYIEGFLYLLRMSGTSLNVALPSHFSWLTMPI